MSSMLLSILTRRYADDLLEATREMTLAAEAQSGSHLRQWSARPDKPLRVADSHALLVGMRRHPNFRAEGAQEVVRAERNMGGKFRQADGLGVALVDVAARPFDGCLLPAEPLLAEAQ